jgi:GH25 family lysozyme M1 (1,4-beta-N-acetylmuramidase)
MLNKFGKWYADYEEKPQTPYHFTWWQYSESAGVPGIDGAMDLNI